MITKLREHEPELKAAGIVHLRLHGSLARGTATATSDIDLIADFDASRHLSLLDMVGLENRLSGSSWCSRRSLAGAHSEAARREPRRT